MRIGMHVRGFEGGKAVAVERALERKAEVIQIFATSPRMWRVARVYPEADLELRRQMRQNDVKPLFLHAAYLINLASPTSATRDLSRRTLEWNLQRADDLVAAGVVVHAGAAINQPHPRALRHVATAIGKVLGNAERGPKLLVELTAGGGGPVACNFEQASALLDACAGHPLLGFCIDTCHLHAAGYDVTTEEGIDEMVGEMRSRVGLRRIALIHANDSRDPRGSRRDRHWHIGQGFIGRKGFRAILNHPQLQRIPVICETPGLVQDDRRNITALKTLRPK